MHRKLVRCNAFTCNFPAFLHKNMDDKQQTAPESHRQMSKQSFSAVQNLTNYIDRNLYYIRYTSYGLAAIGVILIGRSVYITRKFQCFKEIPAKYISEHVKLQGRVKSVNHQGVIGVDHIPIITSRYLSSHRQQGVGLLTRHFKALRQWSKHLQVVLGSVQILEPGIPWLQNALLDKVVWFRMLSSCPKTETLSCIVNVKKNAFRNLCINEEIIKEGLAKVEHLPDLTNDKTYSKFSKRLTKAEIYAKKKGKGVWIRPTLKEKLKEMPRTVASNTGTFLRQRVVGLLDQLKWWKSKE